MLCELEGIIFIVSQNMVSVEHHAVVKTYTYILSIMLQASFLYTHTSQLIN